MNTLGIINYKRINTILSTRIPHSLRFMIQLELLFRRQMERRIKTNHTTTTCRFWPTSCYIDCIHLIYNTLYPISCSAEEIGCLPYWDLIVWWHVTLLYVCCDIDFNKKVYLCDGPSCSPAGARKKVIY